MDWKKPFSEEEELFYEPDFFYEGIIPVKGTIVYFDSKYEGHEWRSAVGVVLAHNNYTRILIHGDGMRYPCDITICAHVNYVVLPDIDGGIAIRDMCDIATNRKLISAAGYSGRSPITIANGLAALFHKYNTYFNLPEYPNN